MAKILSFDSGQFVKYPLFNRFKDWWDIQDKFIKLTLVTIVLLAISTPVIVTTYLTLRQEASNANKKIFLGINNGKADVGKDLGWIQADLESIKNSTGAYPAVYVLWANFESNPPKIEVLNYLDSKGITPMLALMPRGRDGTENRRDGRFILSESSTSDVVDLGKIKFDSLDPATITKIYVSKESSIVSEDPSVNLEPSWVVGEKIEVFGTNPKGKVDYDSGNNFQFEITGKTDTPTNWILSVKPLKTTPFKDQFKFNEPVFITPSTYFIKNYGNAKIANGSMDGKFREIAQVAAQFNKTIVLRYAQEMNADYYTWTDEHKSAKDEKYERYKFHDFGNKKGDFIDSWRHIYDLIKPIAPNMLFFWNPHNTATAKYVDYFPKDKYVDFVGIDVYSGSKRQDYKSLEEASRNALQELRSISDKPIIIGETGINSTHSSGVSGNFANYRKNWLRDGYYFLANEPKVKGVLYFNVNMGDTIYGGQKENNWLLSDPTDPGFPEIASTYRTLLLDPRFQGKLRSGGGDDSEPPTVTITPFPTSDADPKGYHDYSSCVISSGWSCDLDGYQQALNMEFYADNPKGSGGILLGNANANLVREQAVGGQCGGNSSHGFNFATPATLSDGRPHKIYAYATNIGDGKTILLKGSPKTITCGAGGTSIYTSNVLPLNDSYTASNQPSQNYGRGIYLKADASPLSVTYLKFDTSGYKDKTIKSVFLELTVSKLEDADSALAKGLDARAISNSWTDIKITHNNHPIYGNIIQTHKGTVRNGDKVKLDITDYIKSNLGVVSLALVNRGSDGVIFNSMESTGAKPKLIITYQ